MKVMCHSIKEVVEIDSDGRFELPDRRYSTTELKAVAREINRVIRESKLNNELGVDTYDEIQDFSEQ